MIGSGLINAFITRQGFFYHSWVHRREGGKTIKADAAHEEQLVNQHVTFGAQFAFIAIFTQNLRAAIAAPIAETREADLDQFQPVDKGQNLAHIIARFNARAEDVYMVGDSLRDLQAIAAVGGKSVLVLTGKGEKTLQNEGDQLPEGTLVFDNLMAFSQYIMQQQA